MFFTDFCYNTLFKVLIAAAIADTEGIGGIAECETNRGDPAGEERAVKTTGKIDVARASASARVTT